MILTLNTRKPINKITIEDLEQFPIWEFALDEEDEDQDETYVRPINSKFIPLGNYSMSVFSYFTTSSGLEFKGVIEVSTDGEIEIGHGALLFNNHYVFIPNNNFEDSLESYNEISEILELNHDEIFPLTFRLSVLIESENKFIEGQFSI